MTALPSEALQLHFKFKFKLCATALATGSVCQPSVLSIP